MLAIRFIIETRVPSVGYSFHFSNTSIDEGIGGCSYLSVVVDEQFVEFLTGKLIVIFYVLLVLKVFLTGKLMQYEICN